MRIETTTQITLTLTKEELNAVKTVHNMLACLPVWDIKNLNNKLSVDLVSVQDSLASIYALANGDIHKLDR